MANYKLVDADQLDADLKTVADAIREKGGTTDELVFPDGMATAVSEIQSGGDSGVVTQFVEGTMPEVIDENATKIRAYGIAYSETSTVRLPNVKDIGTGAFYGSSVVSVELDKYEGHSNSTIKNMFHSCANLQYVYVPSLTQGIGTAAFYNCTSLKELCIFNGIAFEKQMLYGCTSLEKVDGYNTNTIIDYAFYNCKSLYAVILRKTKKPTTCQSSNCFNGCVHFLGTVDATYNPTGLKDGYIYVPRALIEDYKVATNWVTFADQFRALEDYTVDGTTTGAMDWDKINGGA